LKICRQLKPDKTVEKTRPCVASGIAADGAPSKAALGFALSCALTFEQLERLKTDKGEWLSFTKRLKGRQQKI